MKTGILGDTHGGHDAVFEEGGCKPSSLSYITLSELESESEKFYYMPLKKFSTPPTIVLLVFLLLLHLRKHRLRLILLPGCSRYISRASRNTLSDKCM